MHIRTASEADIREMHRIRMAVGENRLLDPTAVQPDDYRRFLSGGSEGWVAELNGRIVGFAIADLVRANVWALFVEPGAEGRGIGRALHDRMMDRLFAAGAERVWLTTDPGTRAERFYRAAGWLSASTERREARFELSRQEWHVRRAVHPSVKAMWGSYLVAHGQDAASVPPPGHWHFCDNEQDANECARLVLAGRKRATSPSLWYFESRGEPIPQVGEFHVVMNWNGEAACVIRTTAVRIVPFDQVGEEHAAAEGEGDGTLESWRRVHWDYYHRELEGTGFHPRNDMPIVCEYFECVYRPPSVVAASK